MTLELTSNTPYGGSSAAGWAKESLPRGECGYASGGEFRMVRWHRAAFKTTVGLGAIGALLVTSGAGMRWGDAISFILGLF